MFALFKWKALFASWQDFAQGFGVTIAVSAIALVLTLIISLVVGLIRCSHSEIAKRIAGWYINFFQNTPLVVQIFFFYNVLPRLGILWSPFVCGFIGLALYTGAFGASVIEASIYSVPRGQLEAAYSHGFGFIGAVSYIISPQVL